MKYKVLICLLSLGGLFSPLASAAVVEVDSAEEFLAAIEGGEQEIKITGNFSLAHQKSGLSATLEQDDNYIPLLIPGGTHIYADENSGYKIGFRFPVQITGDVTIEHVSLDFSNTADYQRVFFMAGHVLTLKHVKTTESVHDFSIYAGSFDFATDAPTVGTAAQLTLDAPNAGTVGSPDPDIGVIYLSPNETTLPSTFKTYTGSSAMTLSQKTYVGQVDAKGASITVNGEGSQASTTAYVTDKNTVLTLNNGVTQYLTEGTFKEVIVPSGATLALTNVPSTSTVAIAQLTGGGMLLRDNSEGQVAITRYTGNTTVRSLPAAEGQVLLKTAQVPTEIDGFTLDSDNQNAGYMLDYQDGALTLIKITYYSVGVYATPEWGGSVSGDGGYLKNASVTVSAVAAEGYTFVGWGGSNGASLLQATETLKVTEHLVLDAYFMPTELYEAFAKQAAREQAAGLAMGAPVIYAEGEMVELGIELKMASELPSEETQWQAVSTIVEDSATFDAASGTLKVKLPAGKKGFFKFVKAAETAEPDAEN